MDAFQFFSRLAKTRRPDATLTGLTERIVRRSQVNFLDDELNFVVVRSEKRGYGAANCLPVSGLKENLPT